jgi:hypothetical protein
LSAATRRLVVPIELVDEPDAPNRIPGLEQFPENGHEVIGNGLVADHLADLFLPVKIDIREP